MDNVFQTSAGPLVNPIYVESSIKVYIYSSKDSVTNILKSETLLSIITIACRKKKRWEGNETRKMVWIG